MIAARSVNKERFYLCFVGLLSLLFPGPALTAAEIKPVTSVVPGRFAFSLDGNHFDEDDIGALAMIGALSWAGGISDRVVHIDHSNNLGDNTPAQAHQMIESAKGIVAHFNIKADIIFNDQTHLDQAQANFKIEAEKSTAANPLWLVCAGPMEVPHRLLAGVNTDCHPYIHCVSHSKWNNTYKKPPSMTHTWATLKSLFPKVNFHRIKDQNGGRNNTGSDWATELEKWFWLRDSLYQPYRWLYSRNQFTESHKHTRFDVSDAGMLYWLLSGGPKGGDAKAGVASAKALLEKALTSVHR